MKIQCNVCAAAEAKVLCCADEAALCNECDRKVHAVNKLASKHQRVPLSTSSSQMPKCDICQETSGYFFCLEDRALLCRRCDVAVHTANRLVSAHQRFLVTGVKVGLQATEPDPSLNPSLSSEMTQCHLNEKSSEVEPRPLLKKRNADITIDQSSKHLHVQASADGDTSSSKAPFSGGSTPGSGSISQWHMDEFFEFGDYNQSYDFMDHHGSSKTDYGKLGDSDYSPILRVADMEVQGDECAGQSPGTYWAVPEIPSPPTSSGLCWSKITQTSSNCAAFVPDVISLNPRNSKRRKRF